MKNWLKTAHGESAFKEGDEVEIVSDIFDFDTGELRVEEGSEGKVSYLYNPEYARIKFSDGSTFSVYHILLKKVGSDEDSLKAGDEVVAVKDILDMVGSEVLVPEGEKGTVADTKGKDFIRVGFPCHQDGDPIGVHSSEVKKSS